MVAKHMPSEMAEKKTEGARETERQAAHHGAENAEGSMEDTAAACAVNRDTVMTLHAADSMGRLLFSR